jgi:hypothetical protein
MHPIAGDTAMKLKFLAIPLVLGLALVVGACESPDTETEIETPTGETEIESPAAAPEEPVAPGATDPAVAPPGESPAAP